MVAIGSAMTMAVSATYAQSPIPVPVAISVPTSAPAANVIELKEKLTDAFKEYATLTRAAKTALHDSKAYKDAVVTAAAAQAAFEKTAPFTTERIQALGVRDSTAGAVAGLELRANNTPEIKAVKNKIEASQKAFDAAILAASTPEPNKEPRRQTAAPKSDLVGSTYDKFTDQTCIVLDVIDRGEMPAAFHLLYSYSGVNQKNPPDQIGVMVTMSSSAIKLLGKGDHPSLILLCNDSRYAAELTYLKTERPTPRIVQQTFCTLWKMDDLRKMSVAKKIDMRFPNGIEHTWTAEELKGLQDFASRAQGQ